MGARVATLPDLLQQLAFAGVTGPAALRGALGGISPQTLGRLVAEAGDGVYRMGRGPATEYARTRAVEGVGLALPAFRVDGSGQPRPDGTLRLLWGGRIYWERGPGGRLFAGLPPELVDMAPQGFLGRGFPARYSELRLPTRLADWSDDHRLVALARRGEDCVGDLIVGDESFERFMVSSPDDLSPDEFGALAARSATELVGSSAGGERPKFGVLSRGRHVLVKFAPDGATDVARRWRDLLWCECKALELIAAAGRPASRGRCFDQGGWRFLEVERFDRVGERGRRAAISLFALNNEYLGTPDSWSAAAPLLGAPPFSLPEADSSLLRWLDVFGQLIGNTDRHFGNVSFLVQPDGSLRVAPAYDMLPMILAPTADVVVSRRPEPAPPSARTLDVWLDAAAWAQRFWGEVRDNGALGPDVRRFAEASLEAISRLAERVAP
jgi:hypothetical protein